MIDQRFPTWDIHTGASLIGQEWRRQIGGSGDNGPVPGGSIAETHTVTYPESGQAPPMRQTLPNTGTGTGGSNPPGSGDPSNGTVQDPIQQLISALTATPSAPPLPQDVPYASNVTQGPNIIFPLLIMAIGGFGIYYWYKHRHHTHAAE